MLTAIYPWPGGLTSEGFSEQIRVLSLNSFQRTSLMQRLLSFFWPATPPSPGNTASIIPYTVSSYEYHECYDYYEYHHAWKKQLCVSYVLNTFCSFPAVSLLNLHEEIRSKPSAWVPVGWIPKYDQKRAEDAGRKNWGMYIGGQTRADFVHTMQTMQTFQTLQDHRK